MELNRFKMISKNINKKDNKEKLKNSEANGIVKLNILGSKFVKNNKAKLIIYNKKRNLHEFLKIKNIPNNNTKIGMIFSKFYIKEVLCLNILIH